MSKGPPRNTTIDVAKCLAIVAIVFGHVNRGLAAADLLDPEGEWFRLSDHALYLVHLCVFALLTGVFVARGVTRDGPSTYARARIGTFLYLYVLWSVLQGLIKVAAGDNANTSMGMRDVLELWNPDGQMWFFGWLVVVTAYVVLVRPWESARRRLVCVVLAVPVTLIFWGWSGNYFGTVGLALVGPFVAGCLLGPTPFARLGGLRAPATAIMCLASFSIFAALLTVDTTAPTVTDVDRSITTVGLGLVASTVGVLGVLMASVLLSQLPGGAVLTYVGTCSLEIFLAHIIAAAGARIVLVRHGVESVPVHLALGTVCGVVLPLGLLWACRRVRFPYLFAASALITGMPQPVARRGDPTVDT